MQVRSAVLGEQDRIATLLMDEMWPEIGFGKVDYGKGRAEVEEVIRRGVAWLIEEGDEIVATAGLIPSQPFWWSSDQFLIDKWVFVRPNYRKSRAAILLMQLIARTAFRSPVPVLIAISSPINNEAKHRLFARYGERIGNFYQVRPMKD